MQISELLAKKGDAVVTIKPEATVASALAELAHHNIGAVVVSSDGKAVGGIVSERDIVRALHRSGAAALEESAASVMSSEVHTCKPQDTVESLMAVMTNRRFRHVPVENEGVLAGMISIGDVVKNRVEELEQDREALMDYINAR